MFEQLMDLVKQHAGGAINNNPDVPNEQNEAVTTAAGGSIMDTLKSLVSGGGASQLTDLFHSQSTGQDVSDHPVTQTVTSDLISNLMNKFGFNSDQAGGIANNLVPKVINSLTHKTNDPNDSSFDLQGILSSLGGGLLDRNHDGKVNMGDITSAFGGGGTGDGQTGSDGIVDKIKGLFGK